MSNQYDYDDDDDFDVNESGPANLRKALKKAEKDRKMLEEQLSSLKSSLRQRSVKDVLEAKGVNSKIAAFIPADVEAPEAIAAWLDEYADVFGFQSQQTTNEPLSEEAITQQRMDNSISKASVPEREADLMTQLKNVSSKAELDQMIFGSSQGR